MLGAFLYGRYQRKFSGHYQQPELCGIGCHSFRWRLLAFVVLYNLANININERIHELATIKVLGFTDLELSAYIYRENIISSLAGMIIGLFGGIFLTRFVVQTAEVDIVMFSPDLPLYCFLLAALVTIVFVVAVNFVLYFRLKKIDMATSLKAIE